MERRVEERTAELSAANASLEERAHLAVFAAQVGLALTRSDVLQDTLRHCAEVVVHHLDAAFARIWTFNEAENMLEMQASAGLYTHVDGAHARVPVGKFKIGLIAEERKPHLTNAVIGDPRVGDQAWARREGMACCLADPAASRLQPQTGASTEGAESQRRSLRHGQDASPLNRRTH